MRPRKSPYDPKLLASHEAMGSAPLVPFVSLVTWRLHSGTQRALIARFMSRARARTRTHTRTHMNACLRLSPSPPLVGAMHMHARAAVGTCGRGHAHLLVLSHSSTASSQVPAAGPFKPGAMGRTTTPYNHALQPRPTTTTPFSCGRFAVAAHPRPRIPARSSLLRGCSAKERAP